MKRNLIFIAVLILIGGGMHLYRIITTDTVVDEPVVEEEIYEMVTYEGDGFTYQYPDKYSRGIDGLWTNDRIYYYKNPRPSMPSDMVPDINSYTFYYNGTAEDYMQYLYELDYLPELEEVELGDLTWKKWIHQFDQYTITHYITDMPDKFLVFRVFYVSHDNEELAEILSSVVISSDMVE